MVKPHEPLGQRQLKPMDAAVTELWITPRNPRLDLLRQGGLYTQHKCVIRYAASFTVFDVHARHTNAYRAAKLHSYIIFC